MPPTNIFDLPLELRQQIYRECMPHKNHHTTTMRFNDDSVENVEGLRRADPVVAAEFLKEESRVCNVIHFLVTTGKWTAPPSISSSAKYMQVKIEFGLYPYRENPEGFYCPIDYTRNDRVFEMSNNLRTFVHWINSSKIQIGYLEVSFRGSNVPRLQWCTKHKDKKYGVHEYHSLATMMTEMSCEPEPIVEVLLQPLHAFPVVKDVVVDCLGYIDGWEQLEWQTGVDTLYEGHYMFSLCDMWEDWLQGKRDVPRLQQLVEKLREERPGVDRLLPFNWVMDMP